MNNKITSSLAKMPMIGLGTWMSTESALYNAVECALQTGYKHIDCAPIYGNQTVIGKALKDSFSKKIITREKLWVTSKLWNSFHAPEDVEDAIKNTLCELKLDYLDLFLIHWPIAFKKEVGLNRTNDSGDFVSLSQVPLTDTWQAMEELVKKGLCAHIGVSNFSISKIQDILKIATIKPYNNQVESHPFFAQDELLEFCNSNDIILTAYAPLGSGAGSALENNENAPNLLENKVICEIANKHHATPAQVALAWQINRRVVVIPKSTNEKRIKENFGALQLKLDIGDIEAIDQLNMNYRYYDGSFFNLTNSPYTVESIWE